MLDGLIDEVATLTGLYNAIYRPQRAFGKDDINASAHTGHPFTHYTQLVCILS